MNVVSLVWSVVRRNWAALACGLALLPAGSASAADPMDWPSWRGPEQNGISREVGLPTEWDFEGTNLLWKNTELATRSSPIILNGKLYTLARSYPESTKEGEKVICADAATGKVLWENKFNVYLSDVPAERVAWGAVVGDPATGRIYAMGVCGYFQCMDGETGKTIWSRSLNEEFGLLSTYGGRTNVAVVYEDLVLISAVMTNWGELSIPAHRFIAFDKNTGEVVWFNGTSLRPDDTTYSTPFMGTIGGQAAMVFGSGDGRVWAFQPRTGKPLWNYQLSLRGLNVSPLISNDVVYAGQSEENPDDSSMGAVAAIKGLDAAGDITKTGALWRNKKQMVGKSSPLLIGDRVYAFDDGNICYVLDAKTGEQICRPVRLVGSIMRASPVFADGRIYACTTSAWHVIQPDEKGAKVTHKLRFPNGEEIHGSPAVSHGRIYLPSIEAMYCIGLKDAQPKAEERPAPPKEDEITDKTPAQVQVVPAEVLMKPGEKQAFKVKLYNARGQFVGDATDAKFSVDHGGEIDASGNFTAMSEPKHIGTYVNVEAAGITGKARVRIVPPLPWSFDFEDVPIDVPNPVTGVLEGEPYPTWIGVRYRHKVRKADGNNAMVKVTTIPKGTRSQSWFGPTDLHDYTIQAEVSGAKKDTIDGAKLPDIGLIAQRYTLDMMGNAQQLQIRSWTAQLQNRFAVNVPFKWEPNVTYVLKFRAETSGDKAVLKGKAWKKGDAEPAEWTIEGTDEVGNLVGSPGIFGNAGDAEITYDNITVTPN
jgi:outer membrane protein assembly factor BamB